MSATSFTYDDAMQPVDDAAAHALVAKLEATGATDWRVDFVRSGTGEPASSYRKTALEALCLADELAGAQPPMIATLVALAPVASH
jgi:hypothetical protein